MAWGLKWLTLDGAETLSAGDLVIVCEGHTASKEIYTLQRARLGRGHDDVNAGLWTGRLNHGDRDLLSSPRKAEVECERFDPALGLRDEIVEASLKLSNGRARRNLSEEVQPNR